MEIGLEVFSAFGYSMADMHHINWESDLSHGYPTWPECEIQKQNSFYICDLAR